MAQETYGGSPNGQNNTELQWHKRKMQSENNPVLEQNRKEPP